MRQQKDPVVARYETGQRLRQFEILWERATPEQKRQVLPLVNQAVMGFFAGGPSASAKPLDQAALLLGDEAKRTPERRWGVSLAAAPTARLLDSKAGKVEVTLSLLYEGPERQPETLSLMVVGAQGTALARRGAGMQLKELPRTIPFSFSELEEDTSLSVQLSTGNPASPGPFLERSVPVSFAKDLKARLVALEKSEEPSVVHLRGTLKKLVSGEALETDFPGLKLLRDAEAAAKRAPLWGKKRPGQFWLTLAKAPVRLLAPKAVESGKPLPLVLALHGAGGSENMFFDTYGAGKLVRLCEERGWLLLTLRNGAGLGQLPELLAELGKLYPYDPKRVFLTGHSMGAAMAVQAVQANPKLFSAVAVLGGGGAVRSEPGTLPPFLVGAGEADFGKPMAQSLAKALKTECKLYPHCEHLTVVQDALGDVVAFFAAGSKPASAMAFRCEARSGLRN